MRTRRIQSLLITWWTWMRLRFSEELTGGIPVPLFLFDRLAHYAEQLGHGEGLLQQQGAGELFGGRLLGIAGDEDHLHAGERASDGFGQLRAGDAGHHYIGQQNMDRAGVL